MLFLLDGQSSQSRLLSSHSEVISPFLPDNKLSGESFPIYQDKIDIDRKPLSRHLERGFDRSKQNARSNSWLDRAISFVVPN